MTISPRLTPQYVAEYLCSITHTHELTIFACNAIEIYFDRIVRASEDKLIRFGLRPVIAPMAAESALARVECVEFSHAYLHALVAGDPEVAVLAMRAVHFYTQRFSQMTLDEVLAEVGGAAAYVKAAADVLALSIEPLTIHEG